MDILHIHNTQSIMNYIIVSKLTRIPIIIENGNVNDKIIYRI